ncbi:hypothetical protein Taro_045839 [Colocasia esculenta]|uniref:Uncharacterized protein n=1 Tax=Colocasia esculenta TaxID=4460 RepID=A0A843WXZ2_COLES|nr:hypothetical protein [Colocasia esculenta]
MQHETLDHRSPETPPPENPAPPSPPLSDAIAPDPAAGPSLSRNTSSSRLNAQAPEFVLRTPLAWQPSPWMEPRMVQIHRGPTPPLLPVVHLFHPPPPHQTFHHVPMVQNQFEYYHGGGGGYREHDVHGPSRAGRGRSRVCARFGCEGWSLGRCHPEGYKSGWCLLDLQLPCCSKITAIQLADRGNGAVAASSPTSQPLPPPRDHTAGDCCRKAT